MQKKSLNIVVKLDKIESSGSSFEFSSTLRRAEKPPGTTVEVRQLEPILLIGRRRHFKRKKIESSAMYEVEAGHKLNRYPYSGKPSLWIRTGLLSRKFVERVLAAHLE